MDLEKLHQDCGKEQARNYYKLHLEVFKSLAMDLEDVEQDIKILIWQTYEKIKNKIPVEEMNKYIGSVVSRHLRRFIISAIGQESDISLQDFALKGLSQTDEEILESLKQQFIDDDPETAELTYSILYKKLYIGKTDQQVADDLIEEGVIPAITRRRVSDIFRVQIVRKHRTKGKGLKNPGLSKQDGDVEYDNFNPDDLSNKDSLKSEHGVQVLKVPSFLFEDIKPLLSSREYEILEKHIRQNKNFNEIASELSIRKQTAYIFYTRAIEKLRKIVPSEV